MIKIVSTVLSAFLFAGCATTPAVRNKPEQAVETPNDVETAVMAVREAIRNRSTQAKYCPLCGKHYSGQLLICPGDQTPLKSIDE